MEKDPSTNNKTHVGVCVMIHWKWKPRKEPHEEHERNFQKKRVWFPQTGGQKLRKLLFSFFFILNRTSGINVRLEARTHRLYCTAKNRRLEFLVLLIRLFWGDPNYNNNFELNYDVCNPSYGQYEHPRSTK